MATKAKATKAKKAKRITMGEAVAFATGWLLATGMDVHDPATWENVANRMRSSFGIADATPELVKEAVLIWASNAELITKKNKKAA